VKVPRQNSARYRKTDSYLPNYKNCGRPSALNETQIAQIKLEVKKNPDHTLLELIEKFNLKISQSGLSRVFKKLGLTFKKKDTPCKPTKTIKCNQRTRQLARFTKTLEVGQLVFLDKCGVNLALTRLYGWGERHMRVDDYVSDARFERSSILSAVCLSGVEASVSFSGVLNGALFALYVEYVLASTLNVGDVVLLDNLSSHKVEGALDPIFDRGVCLFGFCRCILRI